MNSKLIKHLRAQKPSVAINAPITVKKNASGPNTTMPPTAKPPVVKNNTKNPMKAITSPKTPCTPIHANATTDNPNDKKTPPIKIVSANNTIVAAISSAHTVFHGITMST